MESHNKWVNIFLENNVFFKEMCWLKAARVHVETESERESTQRSGYERACFPPSVSSCVPANESVSFKEPKQEDDPHQRPRDLPAPQPPPPTSSPCSHPSRRRLPREYLPLIEHWPTAPECQRSQVFHPRAVSSRLTLQVIAGEWYLRLNSDLTREARHRSQTLGVLNVCVELLSDVSETDSKWHSNQMWEY